MSTNALNLQNVGQAVNLLKVIAYPYEDTPLEITGLIKNLSWREDTTRASVEVSVTLHNLESVARSVFAPGTWLQIQITDPLTGSFAREDIWAYVWEFGVTDKRSGELSFTGFDVVSFLMRSGERPDWTYRPDGSSRKKGWTAYQIAQEVMADTDFNHTLVKTEHVIPYVHMRQAFPLEVLTAAYTEDRIHTGRVYRIRAIERRIVVEQMVSQAFTWYISEENGIISASYSESLDNVFTDVRATSINPDNRVPVRTARAISPLFRRYGRITKTIQYEKMLDTKRLEELAQAYMRKHRTLSRKATLEAEGIPTLRATDAVVIKDSGTGLIGRFYIDAVEHRFGPDGYKMTLELTNVARVPTRVLSDEEKTKPAPPNSGPQYVIGPDGRPVMIGSGGFTPEFQTLASGITDSHADGGSKNVNLAGLKPNIKKFMEDLVAATPGGQYVISALRPGSVTTSGRTSLHSHGQAVDIAAWDLTNAGTTQALSPSLDFLATLARKALGHTMKPHPFQGDPWAGSSSAHPSWGTTSDSRAEVIWHTWLGGNHYDHVHIGLKSSTDFPVVPRIQYDDIATPVPGGTISNIPGLGPTLGNAALGLNADQVQGARAIIQVYTQYKLDPVCGVAVALSESNLVPTAVGDNGTSFGLFQLHRGGALGSMSETDAKNPVLNAGVAARAMVRLGAVGKSTEVQVQIQVEKFERPSDIPGRVRKDIGNIPKARTIVRTLSSAQGG